MNRNEALEQMNKQVGSLYPTDTVMTVALKQVHDIYDYFESRTCERCRYYGCVDENIYSSNVCSQYQKVFINKRDGFHLLKCIKEPHNSCDLWECKDD